jgi:hypothetical protein
MPLPADCWVVLGCWLSAPRLYIESPPGVKFIDETFTHQPVDDRVVGDSSTAIEFFP